MLRDEGLKAKLLIVTVSVAVIGAGVALHEELGEVGFPEEVMGANSWSNGSSSRG